MSRVGKKPIIVPQGTKVDLDGRMVTARGPLGELSYQLCPDIDLRMDGDTIHVLADLESDNKKIKALWGVSRAMVNNLVVGVSQGFSKTLEIKGTGWRFVRNEDAIEVNIGYAHPVRMVVPDGLKAEVTDRPPKLTISGIRKQAVGQFAAEVRALKPPEPYQGKGIRLEGEQVRRKAGKSAG